MTQREFVQDYAGIINLLKEHAFLQYAPSGAQEYSQKQRSAVGYFVHLIFRVTGMDLPVPDYSLVDISPTSNPSYQAAKTSIKRTAARFKAASQSGVSGRQECAQAAGAWLKALDIMDSRGRD